MLLLPFLHLSTLYYPLLGFRYWVPFSTKCLPFILLTICIAFVTVAYIYRYFMLFTKKQASSNWLIHAENKWSYKRYQSETVTALPYTLEARHPFLHLTSQVLYLAFLSDTLPIALFRRGDQTIVPSQKDACGPSTIQGTCSIYIPCKISHHQ